MPATAVPFACARCQQPIDTAPGYLVSTEDGLQFTNAADPQVSVGEEPMHFVCPVAEAPAPNTCAESEQVALTERGHEVLHLVRCQDRLPSSWLSDFIRAVLDRRIASVLATA